jgi:hypothetical protein
MTSIDRQVRLSDEVEHTTYVGEKRNAYKGLVGNPEEERPLVRLTAA